MTKPPLPDFAPCRATCRGRALLLALLVALAACAGTPEQADLSAQVPLALVPAGLAGGSDARAAFRRHFCALLEGEGRDLPDYRPCDETLLRLAGEDGANTGATVPPLPGAYQVLVVPGVGWDCLQAFVDEGALPHHYLADLGYDVHWLRVGGLSGPRHNAQLIIEQARQLAGQEGRRLVLVGYSKGINDLLEALVISPQLADATAAVLSVAGSVGGSPLAGHASQDVLNLLRFAPGAACETDDAGTLESLRPQRRQQWLADNPLPAGIRYYSMVTLPDAEHVSVLLQPGYRLLADSSPLNDGSVLFYDQVVPGSRLLGYVRADHWAVALPIARDNALLDATVVNHNDFPREVLWRAMLEFVTAELAATATEDDQ